MERSTLALGVTALLTVTLAGCASGIDAQKRASLSRRDTQTVGGTAVAEFAKAHSATLLTGADEAAHVHLTKHEVQGVFRLKGQVCRSLGGCAAVPIDSRGYWLTAGHCVNSGAVLFYERLPDGGERGVAAKIVWSSTTPGLDLTVLYAPLPDGIAPVQVATSVRVGEEVICVGSGIRTDQLSGGHVVGIGGSTDGSVVWLEHDAPLSAGDSGGPAFYRDGVLAGINFEAGRSFTGEQSRATAIQPNMRQVLASIDEDWASRAASKNLTGAK